MQATKPKAPLSDAIIFAVSRLVDDGRLDVKREPSHARIESQIRRAGLDEADPHKDPTVRLGKAKRLEAVLSWALGNEPVRGEALVSYIISLVQGVGGFRSESPNYVGADAIEGARQVFAPEGFMLAASGELSPVLLDSLSGVEMTEALRRYVRRAQRGESDAALVTGTGKDLLEATAAHVLVERFGGYQTENFPTLLGQAFTALGLATSADREAPGEPAQRRLERALYEVGCAVNKLRSKEGTGHGRPFLPTITEDEARAAIQAMGVVAERLLRAL